MNQRVKRSLAVVYGDERLEFSVETSHSQKASIRIDVASPDGIKILAPIDASDTEIRAAVRRRAKWIWKHYKHHQRPLKTVRCISGEEILYLGRRYVLKVETGAVPSAKLKGAKLLVVVPKRDHILIQNMITQWYRQRGQEYFANRIKALYPSLSGNKTSVPDFSLRVMHRQWGSCSPAGKILLNPALILAPRACIDYVITHELCHLQHHNHSDEFYRLLSAYMPDWRERRAFLELVSYQILDG